MNGHVAIVGAGPAGFFAAEALLKEGLTVDLFERLPAPFGLVRYGVAPDHQKIKSVDKGFARTANHEAFNYFGNVTVGRDIQVKELQERYDQVVFASGCQAARHMGIEGEQLLGVHSALSFVSWYNGHPDYVDFEPDLNVSSVAIIGAGDVAMDLSRLLTSSDEELAKTDMPDFALARFRERNVQRVELLIRRGPAQANFALKELSAVVERPGIRIEFDEAVVTDALQSELPNAQRKKLEYLLAQRDQRPQAGIELNLRFLVSPVSFNQKQGKLASITVERNRLEVNNTGRANAVGTGQREVLDAELALTAVGYRGVSLDGIPFNERSGLIPNQEGQVTTVTGTPIPGSFVVGWLKRGPQGVIGTNKGDAKATVKVMLEQLKDSDRKAPPETRALLRERGVRVISFSDWKFLDQYEQQRGTAVGKPREKVTSAEEALSALAPATPSV